MRSPSEWEKILANEARDKVLNIPNIRAAHAAQYQKNKQPNPRMSGRSKQTFLQRRHTDGKQTHGKRLSTANRERNADQNYSEAAPHTARTVTAKTPTSNTPWKGCGEKGTLHYWWECKLTQPLRRAARRLLNNLRQSPHMTQQPHFWASILRKPKFKRYRQCCVHSSTTHNSRDTDTQTLADADEEGGAAHSAVLLHSGE